jgi:integrase
MSKQGGLSYQMLNALKAIFHPGGSRFQDKQHGRNRDVIRGIGTMQSMVADVHAFSRFIRDRFPEVKHLNQVKPDMAQAFITELVRKERSGGRIGRVAASIRKLDRACRVVGIFPKDAPALLPYKGKGSVKGFHSQPRTLAYTDEQAAQIIEWIYQIDPVAAEVLQVMDTFGLRIKEACYLNEQNIHPDSLTISLDSNANHTKGGRPRTIQLPDEAGEFLIVLKVKAQKRLTGHLFTDRGSLPDRVRRQVQTACKALDIPCLGTHGFRKTFAVNNYRRAIANGAGDREALQQTSNQLGHNRVIVAIQSYVSGDIRALGNVEEKEKDGD